MRCWNASLPADCDASDAAQSSGPIASRISLGGLPLTAGSVPSPTMRISGSPRFEELLPRGIMCDGGKSDGYKDAH